MCFICHAIAPQLPYMIDRSEWYWDALPGISPAWNASGKACFVPSEDNFAKNHHCCGACQQPAGRRGRALPRPTARKGLLNRYDKTQPARARANPENS